MSVVLPPGSPAEQLDGPDRRMIFGLQVDRECRSVSGVISAVTGRGLDARFELLHALTEEVPAEVGARFERLLHGQLQRPGDPGVLATGLADAQARLVQNLLRGSGHRAHEVLALGVHDPGLWHVGVDHATGYVSLCDGARLAEKTGICVVEAFPARDLAAGGQGGPVTAIAQWMLLHHPTRTRVLLNLGRTTRVTFLPASVGAEGAERVLAFDVGPGTLLLDTLAARLSKGQYAFDPGGRLAVQGRRIPDLINHWLKDPYFDQPPPRWHPLGVRPDDELEQTIQMAIDAGWSIRDLLCTSTHLIAECVRRAIAERFPDKPRIDEILITGGGQQNGMLLGEIAARLPGMLLVRTTESGLADDALEAAEVAALVVLYVDQVPANHPAITGTDTPRVLGRLTAGTQPAWRRLIEELDKTSPKTTKLRYAV